MAHRELRPTFALSTQLERGYVSDQYSQRSCAEGSMIIVLALVAVSCGIAAAVALWPFSPIIALLVAPCVASAIVVASAMVLAARSAKGAETAGNRGTNSVLDALNKLMTR